MKPNYQAWQIDVEDFFALTSQRERIAFLVKFAVLAPSSHNSQPWHFEVSDAAITVRPESARMLPKSDINHRQLFISLGCAVENIVTAADYYSIAAEISSVDGSSDAIKISFGDVMAAVAKGTDHAVFWVAKRRTNRAPYADRLPDPDFMNFLTSLAGPKLRIDVVTDVNLRSRIADVVTDALVAAMDSSDFRQELSLYLKANSTTSPTGMLAGAFGVPGPLSFIAPALVKRVNVNRLSREKDEGVLKKHTPAFVVISTDGDAHEDWIVVGRIFQRVALAATARGLQTNPMAAAIQIGEFYRKLQEILGTSFRPQFFFRLGYSDAPVAVTPRLTAEECLGG